MYGRLNIAELYGKEFTIRTDQKPLLWLFNVKNPGCRLVRWRLKLEEYQYRMEYKAGKENKVADELSQNLPVNADIRIKISTISFLTSIETLYVCETSQKCKN